ncbi:hypothetical protein PG997_007151 [Apiospora hydei]|uniref:non-specific serine/threonine protein kinase n=1 Tax=Apiospora hydei TaxID=1337664 RepID=A0ABR1WS42_9PEZI
MAPSLIRALFKIEKLKATRRGWFRSKNKQRTNQPGGAGGVVGQAAAPEQENWDPNADPLSPDGIKISTRRHFQGRDQPFKYQRIVGEGIYGIAALLHDTRSQPPSKVVIKRPSRREAQAALRQEIRRLRRFRGAAHVLQMVSYRDRDFGDPERDADWGRPMTGLDGPFIVMEYLEMGSFEQFWNRCIQARVRVPNRVLWSIMLCLIRGLIAFAWPPRGSSLQAETIERVPPGVRPDILAHNDLHVGNIMFGSLQPDIREHSLVPQLKIIDLGLADSAEQKQGPRDWDNFNESLGQSFKYITDSLQILLRLITNWAGNPPMFQQPAICSGFETDAILLWEDGADQRYPRLDEALRRLIGRMMARNFRDRPLLEDILYIAEEAVRTRTADHYPSEYRREETDTSIRAFVKRFLLDA